VNKKWPHAIDVATAERIRQARLATKPRITQRRLAQALGVSLQQIQKYESGENRITMGRLADIAKVLGIDLADLVPKKPRG